MKKFTKRMLVIAAVFLALGILLCIVGSVMGGNLFYRMAVEKEGISFGAWRIGLDGIYYGVPEDEEWEENEEHEEEKEVKETEETFLLQEVKNITMEIDAAEILVQESDDAEQMKVVYTVHYAVSAEKCVL